VGRPSEVEEPKATKEQGRYIGSLYVCRQTAFKYPIYGLQSTIMGKVVPYDALSNGTICWPSDAVHGRGRLHDSK
jgi:hypothetical protein